MLIPLSVVGPSMLCGICTHLLCHVHPPAYILEFAAVLFLPPLALFFTASPSPPSLLGLFCVTVIYLLSLGASITLYRLSPCHPLAKCPGPRMACISRLWAARIAFGGHQHRIYRELFAKYGDVVRTGPDHLIVCDSRAIPIILGSKNPWPRHPRYEVITPYETEGNLLRLGDPVTHGKRRRIWDRAFTPAALKSYHPLMHARVAELGDALTARVGAPLSLVAWTGYLAADFMGDFAFCGMFGFMARGKDYAGAHKNGTRMVSTTEIVGTMPWIRPLAVRISRRMDPTFPNLCAQVVRTRMARGGTFRDLFYYMLNEDGDESHPRLNMTTLAAEAGLAIVAGSDTTGTSIASAMFFLIQNPSCFSRLRAELDEAAEGAAYDTEIDVQRLTELPYLQAVLNETMRIAPALPNGSQRLTPREGGPFVVADQVLPAGTAVQIPAWSCGFIDLGILLYLMRFGIVHRDPRYFSPDPEAFLPERWLPDEGPKLAEARGQDFVLDRNAYIPFSYGPGNCVGRVLAQQTMRSALCMLVRRFDARFPPGFAAEEWMEQLTDFYILVRGRLQVVLTARV